MCGFDCVGVDAIVWVDVCCVCVCVGGWVGVGVIAFVRRARDSLDGWCMFVWFGRVVNYVGWDGSTSM